MLYLLQAFLKIVTLLSTSVIVSACILDVCIFMSFRFNIKQNNLCLWQYNLSIVSVIAFKKSELFWTVVNLYMMEYAFSNRTHLLSLFVPALTGLNTEFITNQSCVNNFTVHFMWYCMAFWTFFCKEKPWFWKWHLSAVKG